nr:ubiquitin-specific protease 13 [Tanacetum cinerariifolium]
MDIVAERAARKTAKSEVQSSLKPSPFAGDGDGSGSKEGDGSGSEEEGDEEEDEEDGDEEEDEEEGDEEEDEGKDEEDAIVKDEEYEEEEETVSKEEEEEDVKVKGNKRGRKGKGEVMMSKGKKIKVEDKEVWEKKRKRDSELSSSEGEKPLKKKTKGGKKGKGPSKPTKKVLSDNQIIREKFLSEYPPLLSRTVPSSFFHAIRDAKVNMKRFMNDIGFSALHSVNIDTLPNRLASQFAPKKKKQIFATDIAEKLVCSTRVDFMFKVNFLMLFANVMGKADTMRDFVNLSVVRSIREDTNIAGVDWCDFIHRCLAISHEPNTVSGFYNCPLCFLINRNNRDPPKQVKETGAANVVVGVNEAVDQVKENGRRKK